MKPKCYFAIDEITNTIICVAATKEVVERMTENYQKIFKVPNNKIGKGYSEGNINNTWIWLKNTHK